MVAAIPSCNAGLINGFDPKELGSTVLQAWYKAGSFSGADGDAVGTWSDSSGNSRDVTGTLTQRPIYRTNIINSKPVMRFNGSTNSLQAGSTIINLANMLTLFTVTMQTSLADATICSTVNAVNGDLWRFRNNGGTQQLRWYSTGIYDVNSGIGANNWAYYTCIVRATSAASGTTTVRANGSALGTSGSISRSGSHEANLSIGSNILLGSFLNGDIAELLICSGELSSLLIGQVEGYLKSKYAL